MSVIYGIIMLDGQPLNNGMLDTMKKAMEFCGPDVEGLWSNDHAALGNLTRFNTPESHLEKQPIFFEVDNKVMVVTGRIDNRDDLCAVFSIPLISRDNYPDSHYVKLAYEKWGEKCVEHLLGDWSFAVYDKTSRKFQVFRDHCGIMACYYYSNNIFFAFSSSPKGLLALKEIPKEINEFRLAQILVAWPGDGEQTCYQNIFNLLPGHYLTIQNGRVQKQKYWELTEQEDLILPKEQDYYDRFLEIFTEAVKCRLRTTKQVGISLSGGLDSTSIAAIAAIELAKQNKELFAFTSVPLYKNHKVPKGRNGDEGGLAGLMAKMYPNIRHFLVNAEGYDPIECVKKAVEIQDEPMHAAANQYWIQAINDKAKEYDCGILLTGQGGNGTISWPTGRVRMKGVDGLYYYKQQVKEILRSLTELIFTPTTFRYPFLKYSDIKIEFAEKVDLLGKMKKAGHDPHFNKTYTFEKTQLNLIKQTSKNAYPLLFKKSLSFGVISMDPSGDLRLIKFSCSLPEKIYKKNNYQRILVKEGMKNLVPDEILSSKLRGLQAFDIFQRFISIPTDATSSLIEGLSRSSLFNKIHLSDTSSCILFARSLSGFYFFEKFKN